MPLRRRMRSLPLTDIALTDAFWTRWQDAICETTLAAEYEQLVATERIANFERSAKREVGGFKGLRFNDSDVYKWLEACAYAAAIRPLADGLRSAIDRTIDAISKAQEPDGYLNTYFQLDHPTLKWRNLNSMHEMYCSGHLFEAAAAFHEGGDDRLLEVAVKNADHILGVFSPDAKLGYCGHEEVELGLIRLADATGNRRYREAADWMVEARGKRPSPFEAELEDPESLALSPFAVKMMCKDGVYSGEYVQDHAPIRDHTEVVGHAVRAMYFYIAAADLADEKKDPVYDQAIERVWRNLTSRRMYVTGGIGPSGDNEGFTGDYDLPNLSAYAETCASIGLVFWGHKLLEMTGDAEYAETVERALYNGSLSGISLTGDRFFYTNPLESRGNHERVPWFDCACCPPNIARLVASVGKYVAGVADDGFSIHIPAGFKARFTVRGVQVSVTLTGNYPWSGKFTIEVEPDKPVEFSLRLRVPDWADDVNVDFPSQVNESEFEDGYAVFKQTWAKGSKLTVDLGMRPKWVSADPRVLDNVGRVALTCGPLIYAAESHDLGCPPQLLAVDVDPDSPVESKTESDLGGIVSLTVAAEKEGADFPDALYADAGEVEAAETTAKFIPYYTWSNRGPSHMQVWVRRL